MAAATLVWFSFAVIGSALDPGPPPSPGSGIAAGRLPGPGPTSGSSPAAPPPRPAVPTAPSAQPDGRSTPPAAPTAADHGVQATRETSVAGSRSATTRRWLTSTTTTTSTGVQPTARDVPRPAGRSSTATSASSTTSTSSTTGTRSTPSAARPSNAGAPGDKGHKDDKDSEDGPDDARGRAASGAVTTGRGTSSSGTLRAVSTRGGTVVLELAADDALVRSIIPSEGYGTRRTTSGRWLQVDFLADSARSTVRVDWSGSSPHISVEES